MEKFYAVHWLMKEKIFGTCLMRIFFRKTSLCGIPGDNGEGMQLIKLMSEDDQKLINQIIVYNVLFT